MPFPQLPVGTARVEGTKIVGTAADPSMLVELEMACYDSTGKQLDVVAGSWTDATSPMTTEEARVAIGRINDTLAGG
jgi:hypothetical protein